MESQIIVAVLAGEASEYEAQSLKEWRAADPRNEREYRRLKRLWGVSGQLRSTGVDVPVPTAREIVEIVERRVAGESAPVIELAGAPSEEDAGPKRLTAGLPKLGSMGWKAAALAASLVIGLGLGVLIPNWRADESYGPSQFVTAAGEVATATLQDGTVVHLAPESRLEFSRRGGVREVILEGRAFFAVSREVNRPFRVRLPHGDVEVLGTRFDVEGRVGTIQVAVVEGEVRVAMAGGQVNVVADQVARSVDSEALQVEEVADVYSVIDWLGAFLAFQATPMERVIEEMRRRFDLSIEIADEALLGREVTGWFAQQSPIEMIGAVCLAVDAQCTVGTDGTIRMELSVGSERIP